MRPSRGRQARRSGPPGGFRWPATPRGGDAPTGGTDGGGAVRYLSAARAILAHAGNPNVAIMAAKIRWIGCCNVRNDLARPDGRHDKGGCAGAARPIRGNP